MKISSRFQAVIELLTAVFESTIPADHLMTNYFRGRRYIGAGDRREISQKVYDILRHRYSLRWLSCVENNIPTEEARSLVLAYLMSQQLSVESCFTGETYAPPSLTLREKSLIGLILQRLKEPMPEFVRYNVPEWLFYKIQQIFPETYGDELEALNQEAPLDLRVNLLKTTREEVIKRLKAEKIECHPCFYSPWGIRLGNRRPLSNHPLWSEGFIEVQDEGSQLVALLTNVQPGMTVLDYCAGAGGKTLAMASLMQNKGRIVAMDVSEARLGRSRERLRRAGVHNVEYRLLDQQGYQWLKRQKGRFDCVLVDAPCSGTGTWRRNPDLKWRFNQNDLSELLLKQSEILEKASVAVSKNGLLIYATCSLLPDENENQVLSFMQQNEGYKIKSWKDQSPLLKEKLNCPGDFLKLSPYKNEMDGFFEAILEKV
jgi:16S rRNA (cytosine967-C5)-methyltransferase